MIIKPKIGENINKSHNNEACNMNNNKQYCSQELSNTFLLGLFFGFLGLHYFYLKKIGRGTANITYSNSSNIDQLGKLVMLREKGAISEEEYASKKDILLTLIKDQ